MTTKFFLAALFLGCNVLAASGRDVLELESSYLGEGWFEYKLRTLEDPFLTGINFAFVAPQSFPGFIDSAAPEHWADAIESGKWFGFRFDRSVLQPRLNEMTFRVQSGLQNFKRLNHGFTTTFSLELADEFISSFGIVGYVNLDCLVPCLPEEADGSATNIVKRFEMIHDIKIDQLIITNNQVHGVTFTWNQDSTVQLEGSHNFKDWNYIARFFGSPPQTTWTTNVSLNGIGEFFRLSLVANAHIKSSGVVSRDNVVQQTDDVPITSQTLTATGIELKFNSVAGARYEINCIDTAGKTISSQQIIANSRSSSATFETTSREAAFFKVRQLNK